MVLGVLYTAYSKLGKFSSRHPFLVLGACFVLTGLCCIGFIWLDIQTDPNKLWVDPNSRSYDEQDYFEDKFGKFYRVQQMYFTAKDDTDDTDVFQKEYLEELYHLQNSIESKLYEYDGKHYNISDYCYKPINGKGCYIASPMDYWKMDLNKMLEDPDIKETAQCVNQVEGEQIVCSDRNEIPIIRNVVFGGIDCITGSTSSCDACRIKANALAVTILLMNDDDYIDMGVKHWEKDVFEDLIDDFNDDDSKKLQVSYYSERSVTDELEALNEQNYLYVVMSYVFMFLYISVAIGQFPSKLHTKFMVGFAGITVVICSVIMALGLSSMFGIPLSMISSEVVPFLILAIGVDNMFIISISEQRAMDQLRSEAEEGEEPSHEEALGMALREAGPTITAAAISEVAAFMVGTTTGIPALTNFCLTAAMAVAADFVLQVTAFCAVLELDYRRRRAKRADVFVCLRITSDVPEPKRDIIKKVVKDYYAPALFHPISQVAVLITAVAIILMSFGSYDDLNLGLDPQATAIEGSDLYDFLQDYKDYGEAGPIAYLVFKDINYTNPINSQILDEMADALSQMTDTVQPPVYSWVKSLSSYVKGIDFADVCNNTGAMQDDFNTQVKRFLSVPIESQCCKKYGICGEQYDTDIIFNEYGDIVASRFRFQHTALTTQKKYIDSYRDTRKTVDKLSDGLVPNMKNNPDLTNYAITTAAVDWESGDDAYYSDKRLAYSYSLFYVYYDQYDHIRGVALQNLLLAFGAVFVSIEIITNFYAAFIIACIVAGTAWGLIGLIYIWNQLQSGFETEINAVSVVNLVMCCGLAVEFSVHIMTSFLKQTGTRKERARKAMVDMGSVVITGIVFTKLIGVTVLGFAPSKVFSLYYFRMYLCIIILGFFHGLALQPILLSYIGPPVDKPEETKPKKKKKRYEELMEAGRSA